MSIRTKRTAKRSLASAVAGALVASLLAVTAPAGAQTAQDPSVGRVAGANRYETSVAAARAFTAAGTNPTSVILASGENFPDALAASALSGEVNAPIVLTASDMLPESVMTYLNSVRPATVYIVGGEAAVSAAVEAQVRQMGTTTINRIGGRDRFETAAQIAVAAGTPAQLRGQRTALLATGANFPDALAAGAIAFQGHPILLTGRDTLPDATLTAIRSLGVQQVVVLGGTAVISEAVANQLQAAGIQMIRIAGSDRYETARMIANLAVTELGFTNAQVGVASGEQFPDALSAAPWLGRTRTPLVLAAQNTLPAATEQYLETNATSISQVTIFGGTAAISASTAAAIDAAASATTNQALMVTPNEEATNQVSTASTPNAGVRQYSIAIPAGVSSVNIGLFDASNVRMGADGTVTFTSATPISTGNTAIEIVNGTVVGSAGTTNTYQVNTVQPVNGQVIFTVNSRDQASVRPVVFQDTTTGNTLNFTTAPTATAPQAPSEPFGVGGQKNFVPTEAPLGTLSNQLVATLNASLDYQVLDADANLATTADRVTVDYDSSDTFQFQGVEITMSEFERVAAAGARVTVAYNPNPAGTSVFNVLTASIAAATNAQATVGDFDSDGAADDVRVSFTASTAAGVVYDIFRSADATCDATDTLVANDQANSPVTVLNQNITANASDAFYYCVLAQDPATGARSAGATTAQVTVPLQADTTAPAVVANAAVVDGDAGFDDIADSGDVWTLHFTEAVTMDSDAALQVRDVDGDTIIVRNGVNATFSLNTSPAGPFGAGRVLTVTLNQTLTEAVSNDLLNYPLTITNRAGFRDAAGNTLALTGDSTLEDNGPEFVVGGGTSVVVSATQIRLVFNEALLASSVAANCADFAVPAGATCTGAAVSSEGRIVTLTGTGFAGGTTTVAIAGDVTDTDGQTTATQAATAIPAA